MGGIDGRESAGDWDAAALSVIQDARESHASSKCISLCKPQKSFASVRLAAAAKQGNDRKSLRESLELLPTKTQNNKSVAACWRKRNKKEQSETKRILRFTFYFKRFRI